MSFRRSFFLLLSLLGIGFIAFSVILPRADLSVPFVESGPKSPLTGLPANSGPVLVVKIDDTPLAHPQVGLRSADVIYIEQVEGGLTRLAAVFSSEIPPSIGPVRSARISDIELLAQYGKVGFAYSGAQRKLLPEIAAANLYDLGANRYGIEFYKNDPLRNPPYAMMLNAPALLEESKSRGANLATSQPMGWNFGEGSDTAVPITSAKISWPAGSYQAIWSEGEKRWLLLHNGEPNVDETGYQLGPENFVIQIVSITDSIYKDKVGGVTPFSATVGGGRCYLLRDGSQTPCLWSRDSQSSGTRFTDLTGKEIFFTPGQIWFALTAKEPIFEALPVQDATKAKAK